jgi:2-C-methyl-D-erythritol 4-phosphate cytidylyltransferase
LICNGDQQARWKSLSKGVDFLNKHLQLKSTDIIVTHDAARINVTSEIIETNILTTAKYGYASTVLQLHDSIMELKKDVHYLERSHKYLVQTPQSFQYKFWKNYKPKTASKITDLFTYLNLEIKSVNLVPGSLLNFKITTIEDLKLI